MYVGTNPVTGLFNVDSSTGEVTTLASLDRDAGISQYTLNLQVSNCHSAWKDIHGSLVTYTMKIIKGIVECCP